MHDLQLDSHEFHVLACNRGPSEFSVPVIASVKVAYLSSFQLEMLPYLLQILFLFS